MKQALEEKYLSSFYYVSPQTLEQVNKLTDNSNKKLAGFDQYENLYKDYDNNQRNEKIPLNIKIENIYISSNNRKENSSLGKRPFPINCDEESFNVIFQILFIGRFGRFRS